LMKSRCAVRYVRISVITTTRHLALPYYVFEKSKFSC